MAGTDTNSAPEGASANPVGQPTPEQLLHRLEWRVLRRLDGLIQGDHRTPFYGTGLDFSDLRDYQPDDDVRHIDWNVTARMDSPHVRQYVEDRAITCWFLIDRSPSMDFGHTNRPKNLVVAEFVTAMSRLLTRSGNRVGALLWNNTIEAVRKPRSDRNQVLLLARDLLEPASETGEATDLAGLVQAGMARVARRSLVFVISDYLTEPGWERHLTMLAQRHEVVAVRVVDQREVELPDAGLMVLEDAETGEQLVVDTGDPEFRRRFSEEVAQREQALLGSMNRCGVDLHDVGTEEELATALVRMVNRRQSRLLTRAAR